MDLSESQREDVPEGPTLQNMPSEQVRNQLVNMATVLHRAMATINPHRKKVSILFLKDSYLTLKILSMATAFVKTIIFAILFFSRFA